MNEPEKQDVTFRQVKFTEIVRPAPAAKPTETTGQTAQPDGATPRDTEGQAGTSASPPHAA